MATNLRLRSDAADAVKKEAVRSGRSQQDVIRAAVDSYLDRGTDSRGVDTRVSALEAILLLPARSPLTPPRRRLRLPKGVTSTDLLDREDRI